MNGYLSAIVSLTLFGVWGVLAKFAVEEGSWKTLFVFATVANITIGLVVLATGGVVSRGPAIRWSLATGTAGALGIVFFSVALERISASRAIPITAAYPAVTVALSWILLGERLNLRQGIGILFALAGVALLAEKGTA